MPLPTIIIVPGACQPPTLYQPFASALQAAKFEVAIISTSSVGASPGFKNFDEDVAAVCKVVSGLIEDGIDVIMVMHSYGGIPGSAALKDLGAEHKKREGKSGGVIRLVYLASYALREGERQLGGGDWESISAGGGVNREVWCLR